jgi:hypothetical protein
MTAFDLCVGGTIRCTARQIQREIEANRETSKKAKLDTKQQENQAKILMKMSLIQREYATQYEGIQKFE